MKHTLIVMMGVAGIGKSYLAKHILDTHEDCTIVSRDAIRFGVYTKKSWLSHQPQGDYRSVFPIPETVLTSNPNLEQNPNYL